jgi:hypothetical protein
MIIFELVCDAGHAFEGWFGDHNAFHEQLDGGLVQCPSCGSSQVTQQLSTGGVVRSRKVAEAASPGSQATFLTALRRAIETHFQDVGAEFAKTALRIHYGVEEPKNIRGTTTEAEEKALTDEGVEFLKIPMPNPPSDSELH